MSAGAVRPHHSHTRWVQSYTPHSAEGSWKLRETFACLHRGGGGQVQEPDQSCCRPSPVWQGEKGRCELAAQQGGARESSSAVSEGHMLGGLRGGHTHERHSTHLGPEDGAGMSVPGRVLSVSPTGCASVSSDLWRGGCRPFSGLCTCSVGD